MQFSPIWLGFYGRKPERRFSNGKVPSDLIAEQLGIKPLLPAYLDRSLQAQDLLTGVNFASGAAGLDPLTAQLSTVFSLSDQLELFKEYMAKLENIAGEQRKMDILMESLIGVVVGSNDITNTYFITPFRKPHYDVPSYVKLLVSYASSFVQDSRLEIGMLWNRENRSNLFWDSFHPTEKAYRFLADEIIEQYLKKPVQS